MTAQGDLWQPQDEPPRTARELRDAGMATALSHAEAIHSDWQGQARAALLAYRGRIGSATFQCETLRAFAEDVCGVPEPPDPRAWGAVVLNASRGRSPLVAKCGTHNTSRPSGHCHPAAVWRFVWPRP